MRIHLFSIHRVILCPKYYCKNKIFPEVRFGVLWLGSRQEMCVKHWHWALFPLFYTPPFLSLPVPLFLSPTSLLSFRCQQVSFICIISRWGLLGEHRTTHAFQICISCQFAHDCSRGLSMFDRCLVGKNSSITLFWLSEGGFFFFWFSLHSFSFWFWPAPWGPVFWSFYCSPFPLEPKHVFAPEKLSTVLLALFPRTKPGR